MKKEMLINVLQPEECRIAIVEDGILEELYVERTSQESYVGNIYKGRIVNIEPSIQAAFVDFGIGRNGFLHVSDVEPAYYRHLEQRRSDNGGRRGGRGRTRTRGTSPPVAEEPEAELPEFEALAEDSPPQAETAAGQPAETEAAKPGGRRSSKERPRSRGRSRRRSRDKDAGRPVESQEQRSEERSVGKECRS